MDRRTVGTAGGVRWIKPNPITPLGLQLSSFASRGLQTLFFSLLSSSSSDPQPLALYFSLCFSLVSATFFPTFFSSFHPPSPPPLCHLFHFFLLFLFLSLLLPLDSRFGTLIYRCSVRRPVREHATLPPPLSSPPPPTTLFFLIAHPPPTNPEKKEFILFYVY